MTKVRMSLAEAGDRLGIASNSVRSRWKAGRIEGSRDNVGKIWVYLDPKEIVEAEAASNSSKPSIEPMSKGSTEGGSNPSTEPSSNPSIEGVEGFEDRRFEAQAAHIKTLTGQLERAEAELDALRPKVLEGERAGARAEALEATLSTLRDEREMERRSHREHVQDLRGRAEGAERREGEVRAELAAVRDRVEQKRRWSFWQRLRRGKLAPS